MNVVSVRAVGRVSTGDVPSLLDWGGNPMWRRNGMLHFAVRVDTELQVFALDFEHHGLRRVAAFPAPWRRWETARDAVAPDLSLAVFSGQDAIRAINQRGEILWEYPHDTRQDGASGSVIVTTDGRHVWATAPGPYSPEVTWEYGGDAWLVFDAATGKLVGKATLDCSAAGSRHLLHPDATHVGLFVGEGQDGSPSFWGSLDNSVVTARMVDRDRVLLDVAPDGRSFLTVSHWPGDVAMHDFDDDRVIAEIEATSLLAHAGYHVEDPSFHYQAGYVTANTIIASTHAIHETGAPPDHRHWILDGRTLAPLGRVAYPTTPGVDLRALHDGTWLTAERDHITRWTTT